MLKISEKNTISKFVGFYRILNIKSVYRVYLATFRMLIRELIDLITSVFMAAIFSSTCKFFTAQSQTSTHASCLPHVHPHQQHTHTLTHLLYTHTHTHTHTPEKMDWLFGSSGKGKNNNNNDGKDGQPSSAAGATLNVLSSGVDKPDATAAAVGGAAAGGGFDPTVLERIAAAARELQKSREFAVWTQQT